MRSTHLGTYDEAQSCYLLHQANLTNLAPRKPLIDQEAVWSMAPTTMRKAPKRIVFLRPIPSATYGANG